MASHDVYDASTSIHIEAAVRTNIEIDDELLREAMKATGQTTKRATVEEALRRVVRLIGRSGLEDLEGIGWEGDLDASVEIGPADPPRGIAGVLVVDTSVWIANFRARKSRRCETVSGWTSFTVCWSATSSCWRCCRARGTPRMHADREQLRRFEPVVMLGPDARDGSSDKLSPLPQLWRHSTQISRPDHRHLLHRARSYAAA